MYLQSKFYKKLFDLVTLSTGFNLMLIRIYEKWEIVKLITSEIWEETEAAPPNLLMLST